MNRPPNLRLCKEHNPPNRQIMNVEVVGHKLRARAFHENTHTDSVNLSLAFYLPLVRMTC